MLAPLLFARIPVFDHPGSRALGDAKWSLTHHFASSSMTLNSMRYGLD
jgi:hypothetical protein